MLSYIIGLKIFGWLVEKNEARKLKKEFKEQTPAKKLQVVPLIISITVGIIVCVLLW
jgi:hypothetical protein